MLKLRIELKNTKRVQNALEKLIASSGNFDKEFRDVAAEIRKKMKTVFFTEGAVDGTKWEELSPEYAARKAGRVPKGKQRRRKGSVSGKNRTAYPNKTILRRTDRLFKSLTQDKHPDAIMKRTQGGKGLIFGTRVPWAEWHQKGYARRKRGGRLPRRPISRPITKDKVLQIFRERLNEKITALGFRTGRQGAAGRPGATIKTVTG